MGDRNNPIKFGPEWLRNLPREQAANRTNNSSNPTTARPTGSQRSGGSSSTANLQAASGTSPPTRSGGATQRLRGSGGGNNQGSTGPPGARSTSATSSGTNTRNSNNASRVLLASLRYGREEMLALYDRNVEAPDDLKHFDVLYQPRGKPPAALNNYEDDTRDNGRGGPPAGTSGERFGMGRGLGRGTNEVRLNKMRAPFTRHSPAGRGMSMTGTPRLPMYSGGDEDATTSRAWSASNGAGGLSRTPTEQTDWSKMFRRGLTEDREPGDEKPEERKRKKKTRQTNNTNWRQQAARDDDEWRQDSPRATNRPNADKWDREWGDRPAQDRPQGWPNRRSRGGEQIEDNLPEWAVDNTEGGGAGTFDASGAFHGCSNDDSNLPRAQEPFALTRSHTQGSFAPRKLSIEEGSDEWWASEKAKKLSPKRFDAGDARFKRSQSANANETSSKTQNEDQAENAEKGKNKTAANCDTNDNKNTLDTHEFEGQMREEYGDTNEEPGNFQSVMITTNNSLRQKHQNIVAANMEAPGGRQVPDSTTSRTPEEQIMENFLDIPVEKVAITMSNMQTQGSVSETEIISTTPNPNTNMPMMLNPAVPNHGMPLNSPKPGPAPIQNIGVPNSALNSSLGLPIGTGSNGIGMPMQGMPSVMQNSQINNIGNNPIGSSMQSRSVIGGFHANNGIPVMAGPNAANSLFMNQNNAQQIPSNELPLSSVSGNPIYPMMGLQHSNSFRSIYGGTMPNIPTTPSNNLAEQWFYEDPNKTIQGPFTSRDMYNWYRAGFFNSSLMVRRGCDAHLRPLGSYGPIVPFVPVDMMSPFSMSGFDSRPPANHEMLTPQPTLAIEDTLWSQPSTSRDLVWMQPPPRNETAVNNLPLYFWDQQPTSAISSNSLLPEDITKEMKTEDQILAQLRAQNITPQPVQFLDTQTSIITSDDFATAVKATPDLEELQKLIQNESLLAPAAVPETTDTTEPEVKDQTNKINVVGIPTETTKPVLQTQNKTTEVKPSKQAKAETEKATKNKETTAKAKSKKNKEEKREETVEVKSKEEENKLEKRSAESSPTKSKKEEKPTKKELEREKKEWVKEGFTIVKGPEKTVLKESKKKVEETRAAEEVERKKKEDERLAAEEDKKRRTLEVIKKQQQEQQQKPLELLIRKAPWSATTQAVSTSKDGLTLAEIQRLEKEKKLEQMKEQQHMMQIIAQQQAAAVQREQEMQAVVGWAKKKSGSAGQSLAEIQAETKRLSAAAAAAAAAAQAIEDAQAVSAQAVANQLAWGNTHNGGGFWDPQPTPPPPKPEKPQEPVKPTEPPKHKKKLAVNVVATKKEPSPAVEFESWCNSVLAAWSYKIDVPTFVGFLKDIESPYEVKDYIKCYLDESKDSNDFARQFLERRSKLLRVGMVTPSDDLCSPAMAINPRNSVSDYQEVKGKGKKTKKNKMLKVDARILGFSVTASEDRINVGDIDTA